VNLTFHAFKMFKEHGHGLLNPSEGWSLSIRQVYHATSKNSLLATKFLAFRPKSSPRSKRGHRMSDGL